MTAATFCAWLESDLLPLVRQHHPDAPSKVSVSTAICWLHKLGFNPSSTKKGLYIDGHERKDVVDYRKLYLIKLEVLESTHAPPPPERTIDRALNNVPVTKYFRKVREIVRAYREGHTPGQELELALSHIEECLLPKVTEIFLGIFSGTFV